MRRALLGLMIGFALLLGVAVLGGSTLEGCDQLANRIVCSPGTSIVVFPV
jgi:hypothetical protein